jgi:hypothetical protein
MYDEDKITNELHQKKLALEDRFAHTAPNPQRARQHGGTAT